MGMSDGQLKVYIRGLIRSVQRALEINPDNTELLALLEELQTSLEDL